MWTSIRPTAKGLILLTLVGGLLLSACAVEGSAAPGRQQDDGLEELIVVTGTGEVQGAPDLGVVTLGVEVRDEDLQTALDQVNEIMSDVTDAISDEGIDDEDMQTQAFDVRQEEPRDPETGELTGDTSFVVSNLLNVHIRDIDQVGEIVGAALDAGANRVVDLNFALEDLAGLRSQARRLAAENARDKAEELAQALGVTAGPPLQIRESAAVSPQIEAFEAEAALGRGGGPVISPGQLSVRAQVSVTFRLER
jgi:uncharacterized protein YggE